MWCGPLGMVLQLSFVFVYILRVSKRTKGSKPWGSEGRHDSQTRLQNTAGDATSQLCHHCFTRRFERPHGQRDARFLKDSVRFRMDVSPDGLENPDGVLRLLGGSKTDGVLMVCWMVTKWSREDVGPSNTVFVQMFHK